MRKYQTLGICLAFVLVALALFMRADHPSFLFDSAGTAIANPQTRDLSEAWAAYQQDALKPGPNALGHFTFALSAAENRILGEPDFDPTSFLRGNAILHGLNTTLVFLLLSRLAPNLSLLLRLLLAGIFLLHPLQLTSVAYIMQRRGILATLFYLSAILLYLRATDQDARRRPKAIVIIGLACLYLFCFTSKAMGLTLPFMIAAVEGLRRGSDAGRLKKAGPALIGCIAITGLLIFLFLTSQGLFKPGSLSLRMWGNAQFWGPGTHLLTEARAFVHYWRLIFLPVPGGLSIDHDFAISRSLLEHGALWAILFHAACIGVAGFLARKGRMCMALGIAWFYIALIPYAILPQVEVFVEYKTYIPLVGAVILLAGVLQSLKDRLPEKACTLVLTCCCIILGVLTWNRALVFQSEQALWRDAMNKSPGKVRPMVDYAAVLARDGNTRDAKALYQKAIRSEASYAPAHNNLGNLLVNEQQIEAGIRHFKAALRYKPGFAAAHNNLGRALAMSGRSGAAELQIRRAIAIDGQYADAHSNLGNILADRKAYEDAIQAYQQVLTIDPEHGDARYNLATVFADQGRMDEAITNLTSLAERSPPHPMAAKSLAILWKARGDAFQRAGQKEAAEMAWRKAADWNRQ